MIYNNIILWTCLLNLSKKCLKGNKKLKVCFIIRISNFSKAKFKKLRPSYHISKNKKKKKERKGIAAGIVWRSGLLDSNGSVEREKLYAIHLQVSNYTTNFIHLRFEISGNVIFLKTVSFVIPKTMELHHCTFYWNCCKGPCMLKVKHNQLL